MLAGENMSVVCMYCKNMGKTKVFKNSDELVRHMRSEHVGKLSKQSYEYLKSLGISDEQISKHWG